MGETWTKKRLEKEARERVRNWGKKGREGGGGGGSQLSQIFTPVGQIFVARGRCTVFPPPFPGSLCTMR
jgi:hypothetical protein